MKKSIGAKTIVFPTPVFIVGTYGEDGKPNAMNAAWGGICSSNPPSVAVAIRPSRHTYENIMNKKAFTINIPSEDLVKEADYFGMASGKNVDKLDVTKLTAVKGKNVDAPYIEEFPLNLECKVTEVIKVGVHMQVIGEIVDVIVNEDAVDEKGSPSIDKIKPIMFDPASSKYNGVGKVVGEAFSDGKEFME